MYICLEGIDTAGKSTQILRLKEHFNDAIITKEPGGSEAGAKIREIVLNSKLESKKAEFLLFLADRAEHTQKVILPNKNKLIISDRGVVSGVAYALINKEFDEKTIVDYNIFATSHTLPQKVFLLKLSKDELSKRLSAKELDTIELRGIEYLLDIQSAMIRACELLNIELVSIDASLDIKSITNKIISEIE